MDFAGITARLWIIVPNPPSADRQATIAGISPSRLLKSISTDAEIESGWTVWCQKCDLNRQLPHWQVTACASGDMLNMSSPHTALFSTFLFLLHDGIQSSHPIAEELWQFGYWQNLLNKCTLRSSAVISWVNFWKQDITMYILHWKSFAWIIFGSNFMLTWASVKKQQPKIMKLTIVSRWLIIAIIV